MLGVILKVQGFWSRLEHVGGEFGSGVDRFKVLGSGLGFQAECPMTRVSGM